MKGLDPLVVDVDEGQIVELLQHEVRRIVEDVRTRVLIHGIEEAFEGDSVVQVFAGVQFVAGVDAVLVEHIEDRLPAAAKLGKTFLDQPGNIGNAGETALGHYVVHSFNAEAQRNKEGTMKIFIADVGIHAEQIEAIRSRLPLGWSLADVSGGVIAILTENVDVSPAMIEAAGSGLRLIARLDTGQATTPEGLTVPVIDLPNTALIGVAEHTVMLILALSRHLLGVIRQTNAQAWLPERSQPILTDQRRYTYNWIGLKDWGTLYGKTVGLIGLGLIGRATAVRLRSFGMRLIFTLRHRLDPVAETRLGVQWRELDALLAESDFVSLHQRFQEGPEGNDNHIGARELALMGPAAYLINTARGRLVDENALAAALRTGQIAGAALDVFRHEPLPADSSLFALAGDNLILTPHVAGAPLIEAWAMIAQELIEHLQRPWPG